MHKSLFYNTQILNQSEILSRYEVILPVRFQVGDIVEAKATFMLIPMRECHYKMMIVLRSLTLLDTSFAQVNTMCLH